MNQFAAALGIGLLWGFIIFAPWPKETVNLKKQGAIAVYEGRAKCEKALNEWVCDMSVEPAKQGEGQ